jgi:hypothetical protein
MISDLTNIRLIRYNLVARFEQFGVSIPGRGKLVGPPCPEL